MNGMKVCCFVREFERDTLLMRKCKSSMIERKLTYKHSSAKMRRCWFDGIPSLSWILDLTLSMHKEERNREETKECTYLH